MKHFFLGLLIIMSASLEPAQAERFRKAETCAAVLMNLNPHSIHEVSTSIAIRRLSEFRKRLAPKSDFLRPSAQTGTFTQLSPIKRPIVKRILGIEYDLETRAKVDETDISKAKVIAARRITGRQEIERFLLNTQKDARVIRENVFEADRTSIGVPSETLQLGIAAVLSAVIPLQIALLNSGLMIMPTYFIFQLLFNPQTYFRFFKSLDYRFKSNIRSNLKYLEKNKTHQWRYEARTIPIRKGIANQLWGSKISYGALANVRAFSNSSTGERLVHRILNHSKTRYAPFESYVLLDQLLFWNSEGKPELIIVARAQVGRQKYPKKAPVKLKSPDLSPVLTPSPVPVFH